MVISTCAVCDSKKSKFSNKPGASGLLSSLGIKTPLSKIPLVGSLFSRGINKLIQDMNYMKNE